MKIMCEYASCGPSYVRSGWGHAFVAAGHDFRFWVRESKSAFDAFHDFEPDIFIGTTYGLDSALYKCVAKRPNLRVILYASAWGPYLKDIDLQKYPLVVVSDKERATLEKLKRETGKPDFVFIHVTDKYLNQTMSGWREIGIEPIGILNAADVFEYFNGIARPELKCDVGFVGGFWGYKGRNLADYLLPLCHPDSGLSVKVFGNQQWPIHQWLGYCENSDACDLFASATVCPNVSEPHSTDLGFDCIERIWKVMSSGGFVISDYVEEACEIFSEQELIMAKSSSEFREKIYHFVKHPEQRLPFMNAGKAKVLLDGTYHHRVSKMFKTLGLIPESEEVIKQLQYFLNANSRVQC